MPVQKTTTADTQCRPTTAPPALMTLQSVPDQHSMMIRRLTKFCDRLKLPAHMTTTPIVYTFTADTRRLMRNPATGWMLYIDQDGTTLTPGHAGNYLDAETYWQSVAAAVPHANILYIRLPWAEFEPVEGRYAWEHNANFRAILQGARERGLQLAFRVYVDCSDCQIQATPDWVRAAGAAGKLQVENPGANGPKWNPFLHDPVFRQKFGAFIQALGRRFDQPDEVAFVDGEGLGRWGEMHTYCLADPGRYVELGREIVQWVTATYRAAFPRSILGHQFQNFSLGRDTDDAVVGPSRYVLRRDGLASPIWFKQDEKDRIKSYWPIVPVYAENCYWRFSGNEQWWRGDGFPSLRALLEAALRDAAEIHANTFDLRVPADAADWLREAPDLVEKFQQQAGYRMGPVQITVARQIPATGQLPVTHTWRNSGWGLLPNRAWNYRLAPAFALLTGDRVAAVAVSTADPGQCLPGQDQAWTETLDFGTLQPGRYRLAVGIVDRADRRPRITLAVADAPSAGWLPVGEMAVTTNS